MASLQDLIVKITKANIWSEPLSLKRGEHLSEAGKVDQKVYWIKEGCLQFNLLADGEEQSIRFAYPGNMVSVLDSYISGTASKYSLQALRKSEVQFCTKQVFEAYLKSENLQEVWNQSLYQLILEMMEREQDLLLNSPADRLNRVLKRSPRLFQEVPHKYIASYLRMSPETLSRLLNS